MKKLACSVLLACLFISNFALAESSRAAVAKATAGCSSSVTLPNGAFIYKNSAPLRAGGVGTPLVGFRVEPTLIMNKRLGTGRVTIFNAKGTQIGSCPWASAHGHAGGRARCTMNTRSLRSSALRSGGRPGGYFKVGGTCVNVPDFGRCYGSVKGLCNRLLS